MRRGRALNLSVFVFVVALSLLAILQATPIHAATSPIAKIVAVDHPDEEFPGAPPNRSNHRIFRSLSC